MSLSRPSKQGSFAFNWLGSTASIVLLVVILGANYAINGDEFSVVSVTIAMVIICLLALIPAYIVFLLAKRRVMVGNIAYVISLFVLVGLLLGSVAAAAKKTAQAKQQYDAKMQQLTAGQGDFLKRSLEGEDVSEEQRKRLSSMVSNAEQYASQSSSGEAKAVGAVSRIMKTLELPLYKYNVLVQQIQDAGSVDPATFEDQADIARRIEMIDRGIEANDKLNTVYMDMESGIRRELKKEGFAQSDIDYLVKKWREGARPDIQLRIRETDKRIWQALRGMLLILEESYGEWSVNEDDFVVFDDDAVLHMYNGLNDEVVAASDEQMIAQKELQEVLEKVNKQRSSP